MKAAFFSEFQQAIRVTDLPDPEPHPDGVLIQVKATGICRSDWHGWMGHDADVQLPHVPGHELAGIVVEKGKNVKNWQKGDRVTLPFCCGCGHCRQCASGNQQVCDHYFQPGFTAWGSFAELVHIRYADVNLVRLPKSMDFAEAAVLGCRFITAYRGIVAQGQLQPGQWLAVHGCGGVGLSAITIGRAIGARIITIDIENKKLDLARSLGAEVTLNALQKSNIPEEIKSLTNGGVAVSIDALGSKITCKNSILSLQKRGKHIQIGLMTGEDAEPAIPMGPIIAHELEIIGSHGMQAHQYPALFELIHTKKINLDKMIGQRMNLEAGIAALMSMNTFPYDGLSIIEF